jgi:hypothetical protein
LSDARLVAALGGKFAGSAHTPPEVVDDEVFTRVWVTMLAVRLQRIWAAVFSRQVSNVFE